MSNFWLSPLCFHKNTTFFVTYTCHDFSSISIYLLYLTLASSVCCCMSDFWQLSTNHRAVSTSTHNTHNAGGDCNFYCRKLGNYAESIVYHKQALVLCPLNPSTYSALGYVQSLVGDLNNAVESFHKALGIRREDTFSTNMLTAVIEQLMNSVAPFPGMNQLQLRTMEPVIRNYFIRF